MWEKAGRVEVAGHTFHATETWLQTQAAESWAK